MKQILVGVFLIVGGLFLNAQILEETVLIDFGPNDKINGNTTQNPTSKALFWNNVVQSNKNSKVVSLINTDNEITGFDLRMTESMSKNGIQNGGLLEPNLSRLGVFSESTATQDYFFTTDQGAFKLNGLKSNSLYKFTFFASRNASDVRVTNFEIAGGTSEKGNLKTSGTNIGGNGYHGNSNNWYTTQGVYANSLGEVEVRISKGKGKYAYINAIKIEEFSSVVDALKISVMGSSVADGHGAISREGYAFLYTQLLAKRAVAGIGENWNVSNISVGGDTTVKVMNRWERDFIADCSRYVVYGLSLGNEGVLSNGQKSFDQFRDNMLFLIEQSRAKGKIPVMMNNYTHGLYKEKEYDLIKQMNLLIHEWDVPSVNLLGAIDEGTGKWSDDYVSDVAHPNTAGHKEFSYAIVPSLFDALYKEIPLPEKKKSKGVDLGKKEKNVSVVVIPEATVHPFTIAIDFKRNDQGEMIAIKGVNKKGNVAVSGEGTIVYTNPKGFKINGSVKVIDNKWHHLVLTHYYAKGTTYVYIDAKLEGSLDEKIELKEIVFNPTKKLKSMAVKQLFFYRSGMNIEEIQALYNGKMLKSSLELYVPIYSEKSEEKAVFENLAQSLNYLRIQ
tara:strand:+ start:3103 stop:4947 length:1845 start_codon:yes stop_codon:yes gene_type:complete